MQILRGLHQHRGKVELPSHVTPSVSSTETIGKSDKMTELDFLGPFSLMALSAPDDSGLAQLPSKT